MACGKTSIPFEGSSIEQRFEEFGPDDRRPMY